MSPRETPSTTPGTGGFRCPTPEGLYPHEIFCYMFYNCIGFHPYPHECPDDDLFHQEELYCMHPEDVNCGDLVPRPTASMEPPTSTDKTTTTSGEFQCPEPDGFFPDPESCEHFYICVEGKPSHTECPDDSWFNPETGFCDTPGEFCTPLARH
ncbi:unnamed protein product [Darwinula stevensoni]|uniref:Chitin-binding type-2 domain-containing protein n=1 Tax=Darwinula stevensoni TaxID=69355 RepID=A0A7R8X5G4_9CRUS|nr:unnamed protein product [Darwinula stevensoni]CAG0887080.1 unnamed protein product [Darwinula stevensoni]